MTYLRNTFINLIERIHRLLFRQDMGPEMRQFILHLSWSFVGGIIASGIMFVITIMAGRLLGPEEYGRYNEVLSFGTALSVIFIFGMNVSSIRYLSDGEHHDSREEVLSTSIISVGAVILILSAILLLFPGFWTARLHIDRVFLVWGVAIGVVLALKSLYDGFLRGFHRIKLQSTLRFSEALLILAVFCTLILGISRLEYTSYAAALITGELFFFLVASIVLRRYLRAFNWRIFKRMFKEYNRFLIIGSILGMVVATDRFLIGKLLNLRELGIYGAYYAASHLVVAELGALFLNVFWPSVIKNKHKLPQILKKTTRLFMGFSPIWIALICINTLIFVYLFGRQYPLRYDYVLLFSINTFFGLLFSVYTSFLNISYVSRTIIANICFTVISIGTLILSRNITAYLISQIVIQMLVVGTIHHFLGRPDRAT